MDWRRTGHDVQLLTGRRTTADDNRTELCQPHHGSTFLVSHADLFGLRQAYLFARHDPCTPPAFSRRGLHRLVRHPLMAGFIVVFWAAPQMTAGHLLFAAAATGYILAGIRLEEHDLARLFGQAYRSYQASVPALLPIPGKTRRAPADRERA